MRGLRGGVAAVLAVAALLGPLIAGCGLSSGNSVPTEVGPGSIRPVPELTDVPITVGSKDFSDSINVGYLFIYALQAAGMKVHDLTNIQGSNSARTALQTGQIDLYPEYTGTSWINYNRHTEPLSDSGEMFRAVAGADVAHGIAWVDMARASNTYAIAMGPSAAARYGLRALSDLAAFTKANPQQATVCSETEFSSRSDGLPGMAARYGMRFPPANLHVMGTGTIYQSTASGNPCQFGVVFATDGRIEALHLTLLADDQHFFPQYKAAVSIRSDVLARYPQIADVLKPVMDRLTNEVMVDLNAESDVHGTDWSRVARNWLIREGFVTSRS
ncbi:glycine betaine ABC transporter substrate-binding protein [Pseudonocardia spinosispora]|uniref:glycine betaine ABC transporter substrate-binding protein n=1 Tax=Pseudonocardia spinosispora TaxID=103441 RepID=UPI000490583C|nr:glycine betaine ABC transporter substrate-binding protein [Pseudonocardia spinosispora]